MRRLFAILFAVILASGCSCEKRLQRLQRSCPECFEVVEYDDTTIIPPRHLDTVLHLPTLLPGENIIIQQNNLTLEINIDEDTNAFISADLPADTIKMIRKVAIPKDTKKTCDTTKNLALLAVCLFFAWAIIYTIKRKRK